ncbi:hypothetical protein BDW74DRAFT_155254 [Aspergillus multicolor]|uniref:uncharacterized protein n=1 Tax=Aspergillus multicolor TaxID=41759 RepID=UPI003CCCFA52
MSLARRLLSTLFRVNSQLRMLMWQCNHTIENLSSTIHNGYTAPKKRTTVLSSISAVSAPPQPVTPELRPCRQLYLTPALSPGTISWPPITI